MATLSGRRRVEFEGIDQEIEDQKAERRAQQQRDKKQRCLAKKMAAMARNEDVRFFIYFLQTIATDNLRLQIENDRRTMASTTLMFPDIANDEDVVQAFLRVVSSLELPQGTKRQHEDQMSLLERIMNIWAENGKYDMELDPFLQYLRVNTGQGSLPALMVSLVREEDAEQARRLAAMLAAPNVQAAHARDLTDEVKTQLRLYKRNMEAKKANNCADNSIPAASSGESSNDSDVDEGVYQICSV